MTADDFFKQFQAKDWVLSGVMVALMSLSGYGTAANSNAREELRTYATEAKEARTEIAHRVQSAEGRLEKLEEFAAKGDRVTTSDLAALRRDTDAADQRLSTLHDRTLDTLNELNRTIGTLLQTIARLEEKGKAIDARIENLERGG